MVKDKNTTNGAVSNAAPVKARSCLCWQHQQLRELQETAPELFADEILREIDKAKCWSDRCLSLFRTVDL